MNNNLPKLKQKKLFKNISSYQLFKLIYRFLDKNKRLWFLKTILIMLLTSISEFFTISLVTPLLFSLSSPSFNINNPLISLIVNNLEITNYKQITFIVAFLFLLVAAISSFIKIINLRNYLYFCHSVGVDLTSAAFSKILHQKYIFHINQNSSDPISAISNFTDKTVQYLKSVLQIFTAILASLGTVIALLLINFKFTIITIIFFLSIYLLLISITKKKISRLSKKIAFETTNQLKVIQESMSSIRDIIIGKNQSYFVDIYEAKEKEKRSALSLAEILGASPKFIVEALGLVLIIAIFLFSSNLDSESGSNISETLPFIGAVALGCQRLLPFLHLTYASLSSMRTDKEAVVQLMKIINLDNSYHKNKNKNQQIFLDNEIVFKNVSFKYEDNLPLIIKNVNFKIKKGENIAIIGKTGSGKSTLLDLILGLLKPTKGEIFIDGNLINSRAYNNIILNVSNVPQVINLNDATIKENIAYGLPENKIDINLVKKCAKLALIDKFINSLDKKYEHVIGEKGIKISGGQRQRIGIARALYNQAEILVLDEATSALDKKTEHDVLEAIKNEYKNLTIILVTHRLSTIEFFDEIIKLEDGRITN